MKNKIQVKFDLLAKLATNLFASICLTSLISINAEQIVDRSDFLTTSYLESKDELEDYILDTGDGINIRFKNRPRQVINKGFKNKVGKRDILYLEPRNNLDKYVLDTGDSIFIDFNDVKEFTGNYLISKEGEIKLPRIENTYIKGLTMAELEFLLEKRYEEFLVLPDIDIRINKFKFIPNGTFVINQEGIITLPQIPNDPDEKTRKAFVRGLTIKELKKLLEKRYSQYLMNPTAFIEITRFKPMRISIRGEVRSPGIVTFPVYTPSNFLGDASYQNERVADEIKSISEQSFERISIEKEFETNQSKESNSFKEVSSNTGIDSSSEIIPLNNIKKESLFIGTLSNAIQKAGGLNSYSDISKIKIIRDIPIGKGGGKKSTTINFLSYLNEGDDTSDIRLFDGDYIFVPRLLERDVSIIPKSILSGLSPRFINVTISGQIENSGTIAIPIEGTLSDLMNLSGPRKPLSGKIYLIRYNKDGSILREKIRYSSNAAPGSPRNPYLLAGDLVTVQNSFIGRSTGIINAITEPFVGIYASKEVFEGFIGE